MPLDLFMPTLVEFLHRLADEDLRIDRPYLDPVCRMGPETEPVVLLLRLRIPKDAVGLADFLEAGLRLLVAGMEVGMVLFRQLSVDTLDRLRRGVLLHAQHLVIVPHREARLKHFSRYEIRYETGT